MWPRQANAADNNLMAELRLDPVGRRWVVTGKRTPMPDVKEGEAPCPFCPGNESLTPEPIREVLGSDGRWSVRAFHDRAPVFRIEGNLERRAEGLYDRMNTVGAHEIVVETPEHGPTLASLSEAQMTSVTEVCRDRILDLKKDNRFRYVTLFKDQGLPSSTLLGHSHSQILATPILPQILEIEFRWSQFHYQNKDRCLFCDIVRQEMRQEKRLVDQVADFVALCPFASRFPYELWILPINHTSSFEKDLADPARVRTLAGFLKSCLLRVEKISAALHMIVHTEPNLAARGWMPEWWRTVAEDFHWHIEIYPEIEGLRDYLGTEGFRYNPIPAEEAALALRTLAPGAEPMGPAG
jgi:UDPglucose--hexose-1-phosphate uridylyltransferase